MGLKLESKARLTEPKNIEPISPKEAKDVLYEAQMLVEEIQRRHILYIF